jgi:hypothetical protein
MIASSVTFAMAGPSDGAAGNAAASMWTCVSTWLMLCQNVLQIGFYAVFAWLLGSDNRCYAIAGFVFALIGLIAFNFSIIIELQLLQPTEHRPPPEDPFGMGYATIDWLLALVGDFSILPANGFFALATLRHPRRRPIVPGILFVGLPVGVISLFIPDQASGWVEFIGDWLVPTFVVCKQLVLLWWFVTLLRVVPERFQHPKPLWDGLFAKNVPATAVASGIELVPAVSDGRLMLVLPGKNQDAAR